MPVKIAINGFGRIGRLVLRRLMQQHGNLDLVAINDITDPKTLAHLLAYDSVHGRFDGTVEAEADGICVNGKSIRVTAQKDPAQLPWKDLGVSIVLESTGLFTDRDKAAAHLTAGAKKVIISAPAKKEDLTIVMGVNQDAYDAKKHHVISNASCTTNCVAPMAKVLNDKFGIKRGLMTTVPAAPATQKTVDGPSMKDWRGGRGILENIIPSSTGAAKAVGKVLPELNKKLTGMAFRVPTSDVSVVDLTVELNKEATYEQICAAMKEASTGELKGVLGYTDEKVVSTDFRGNNMPSVFDAEAGIALDSTFVKVVSWYDTEYGYTCNMLRFLQHVAK